MKLFRDVLSGDEMFSDAYKYKEVGCTFEVDCKMIQVKEGSDLPVNEDEVDDQTLTVNDVVYSFRLVETQFDKKSYMTYIKGYMKKLQAHLEANNPERVDGFKSEAQAFVKSQLGNIADLQFFIGESMDPDAMVALLNWREDGITPYITFFKDGLKIEKL
eukprot:NODE_34_length_36538_cov_0.612854.p20 type:complete len:160 gc:universal NODE_34_length_36538_cov_0.612854:7844-7365(-)